MFNCKDSVEFLLHYLEGDLPESEARQLQQHLHGCSPCVDFMKTYRATPKLCKKALAKAMPDEMASKMKDFLRAKLPIK
jgi:anti-sigma factor RsiW